MPFAWPTFPAVAARCARLRPALAALLLAALAVQAGRLLLLLLTPPVPVGSLPATAASARPTLRADVFADEGGALPALLLHGVRAGADGGAAFISTAGGRQAVYRVGDQVAPGVVLRALDGDRVRLAAGGDDHILQLAARAPAAVLAAPASLPPAPPVAARATAAASGAVDAAQLLAGAGLRADPEGGYALMPHGDDALLREAGLAPGDVLVSLNGRTLDPEHLQELREELRPGQPATLSYRRDGQLHTLTLKRPE